MIENKILYDDEARQKLKSGIDKLSDAVKVTLGAKGRNVVIGIENSSPQISKDGITVARSTQLDDYIENIGANLVINVAHKTNEEAGDGTTTATVLAQSIFKHGLKAINSGVNPMDLKRGLDKATEVIVGELKKISVPVDNSIEVIKNIATISANGDETIGNGIAKTIEAVSKDGVITISEASGTETTSDVVEGMQFARGYLSPYFVTDTTKMEAVLDNPLILLFNKRVSLARDLVTPLEIAMREGRPLLIIADEIDPEPLQILIINKIKGVINVVAVKSPSYGKLRGDIMEDIAVITGGKVVNADLGMSLESVNLLDLGSSSKIIVDANNTTIIGSKGNKQEIEERVFILREQIKNCVGNNFDEVKLEERLANLVGGIAIIYVGGNSEVEMKERKDRFEDALNATRAAISEGIVPGGGIALLRCKKSLNKVVCKNKDEKRGVEIMSEIIEEPFRQIMRNAGLGIDVIFHKVMSSKTFDFGYNVSNDKYEKFLSTGVIDPTKVTRVALQNAVSIIGLLLTTECIISREKKGEN